MISPGGLISMIRNRQGQTVIPEYVIMVFIGIGAMTAITVYVQRALQARAHDAQTYMIKEASQGCDANCLDAAGATQHQHTITLDHVPFNTVEADRRFDNQYEPYYGQTSSAVKSDQQETKMLLAPGAGTAGIYRRVSGQVTQVNSVSTQLPPEAAQ